MVPGAICLVLMVALLLSDRSRATSPVFPTGRRWILGFISTMLAVTVVFAAHRSVWLGTLAALSIVFLLTRGRIMKKAVVVAAILVVAATLLLLADNVSGGRVSSTLEGRTAFLHDINKDPTGRWRVGMWEHQLEVAKKNLLMGTGFGQFNWVYDRSGTRWHLHYAHNTYLMWFSRTGLIGLALYLLFWGGVVVMGIQALAGIRDRSVEFLAGVALAGVVGTTVFNFFYDSTVFLWLLGGILLSIAYHHHGWVSDARRRW